MSNTVAVTGPVSGKRSWLLPLVFAAQVPIMLLVGNLSRRGYSLPSLWAVVAISMLVFLMALGESKGRIGGVLITNHNVMSLSRFQIVAWTLLICSAFVTVALARIFDPNKTVMVKGKPVVIEPLAIELPEELWQLLGISGASTIGAALVMQRKTQKTPAPGEVTRAAGAMKQSPEKTEEQMDGVAYRNTDPKEARFTDMFEGDEITNAAYIDISKVQMFFFTLIALVAYGSALWKFMDGSIDSLGKFPEVTSGLVALLGISHATYIGNKSVDQTKTA